MFVCVCVFFPLSPFAPDNLVSRDEFVQPSLPASAYMLILHTQGESTVPI